jgi:hypothetical protein
MTLVIAFGLLLFGLIMEIIFGHKNVYDGHAGSYSFTMLVGGFILSSLAFRDLGNSLKRDTYLTLPVSAFEKFISMWLVTSIGWIVVYTVIFTFFAFVENIIGEFLFRNITFLPFDPFGVIATNTMKYYFVTQGIFLVGAAHFKGYVFPKTLFSFILFGMFCGVIGYFIMDGHMDQETEECMSEAGFFDGRPISQFWEVIKWMFWWILAPLCWIITYLGLKDQEV